MVAELVVARFKERQSKNKMSAHMARDHKTSSSSEDENEYNAVWNHNSRDEVNGRATQTDKSEKNSRTRHLIMSQVKKVKKPSIREMIYQESYDQFNEDHNNVKATPEFRSFVAEKLSGVLDGKLKMTVSEKEKTFNDENSKKNEEDTFRLFSSSCCAPNLSTPESAPHIKRKRPRIRRNTKKFSQDNNDDSSDSDVIDQRLAEAAISGHEILSFSALSTPTGHNAEEVQYSSSDDSASHVQSKRTKTIDGALIKKKVGFKHMELGDDEFLQENVKNKNKTKKEKKKKMDANAIHDDGNEQVKAENCLTQMVSSSELLKENDEDDLSEKNIQKKKKKKKRKKMDTNAIHGNDYEQLKGESCLTQMISSSELSKEKDRGDSSKEIVNKKKKKMKKGVDKNPSTCN